MRPEYITSSRPIEVRHGIIALSGYCVNVAVEHGLLMLSDGIGRDRRFGAFHRVTAGIRRLIVLGHAGVISFEALRWLRDIGAAFIHIDADGSVVTTSVVNPPDDARLRRAQATASTTGAALAIARQLLSLKLAGQLDVLVRYFGRNDDFNNWADQLDHSQSLLALRAVEANAAVNYWDRWKSVEIKFARRDASNVPAHWRQFIARTSQLTSSPRRATSPANALLNYLYALLEAETRIACLKVGLDPGIGLLHADQPSRDSLVLDIIEAIRPHIDVWVLDQLRSRVFGRHDFHETREGVCRILPPLTHLLGETTSKWARLVGPVVERVAAQLSGYRAVPTRLSQSKRSDGRAPYRNRTQRMPAETTLAKSCENCGELSVKAGNLLCQKCIPADRDRRLSSLRTSQLASLRVLRAEGRDPSHGGAAAQARGERVAQHKRDNIEWEKGDDGSLGTLNFTRDIQPQLEMVPIRRLAKATGLSLRYCSLIRRSLVVPHRRHWTKLAGLIHDV